MKRLLIALAAALVLGLCTAGLVVNTQHQRQVTLMRKFIAAGPESLRREQALDRQAGMALTPAQMQRPPPPASQNAAPLYTKLTALLHDKPLGLPKYAEGMDAFHAYTPAQIAQVRRTLAARPDVMALVHQAADRPQCVFVRNWGSGVDLMFPEYQPMREAARLLKTESYLLARDGKYHEAIANQQRGFRVAEHAASDPVLLPYLVGVACDNLTFSGMQSILALAGPNPAVDREIKSVVSTKQAALSLRHALAGESGFGSTCMIKMHQAERRGMYAAFAAGGSPGDATDKSPESPMPQRDLHALIDAWQADYLAHMREIVVACDLPPAGRDAAFSLASKRLDDEGKDSSNPTHLVTIILMPTIDRIGQNSIRSQAHQCVTEAAATLLELKAQTGAFPASLPAQFTDPFTTKPLGYHLEGANGFVVYSAGSDGTFDGGKPGDKRDNRQVVFRYPMVLVP